MFTVVINLIVITITANLVSSAPSVISVDICGLDPIITGKRDICEALIYKFTFNSTVGECQSYTYGGCFGSANLFDSKNECEQNCPGSKRAVTQAAVKSENICELGPIIAGEEDKCEALSYKFTFNSTAGKCQSYTYGGCSGSANLFDSKNECEQNCPEPKHAVTKAAVRSENICKLGPIIAGKRDICDALFYKFTFNSTMGKCQSYTYGGCYGSANLFDSKNECEQHCPGSKDAVTQAAVRSENICKLGPIIAGKRDICDALFYKFTFNSTAGECQGYLYGGCFGSANLFDSKQECRKKCPGSKRAVTQADDVVYPDKVKEKRNVCNQRRMRGVCRASLPRFYYNQKSQRCRQFRYGGCDGNGNNFITLEECRAACE